MNLTTVDPPAMLLSVVQQSRNAYAERVVGSSAVPWWTAVVVTASSERQARRYSREIQRRREQGKIPSGVEYLVVPDLLDQRIGTGTATINALRSLAEKAGGPLGEWWKCQRVLMVHSGGDSRRLPEYSLSGKLFCALPVDTPWGDVSTVFDETLALSTAWASQASPGLVVGSGDVLLTLRAEQLQWQRPGVCGVAIRQSVEIGSQHGVYVLGDQGCVYTFLQKPSAAEVRGAGGLLENGEVALDTGLLHFDADLAARLTILGQQLAGEKTGIPVIDLYRHMMMAMTGQWQPGADCTGVLRRLAKELRGVHFSCSLVEGDFTHVGTTSHFRQLFTEETSFSRLHAAQQRWGSVRPPKVPTGVVVDSVLSAGATLAPNAMAIECDLRVPVRAGRGAILHGLTDLLGPVEIPEDCVVHQVPLRLPDGRHAVCMRVYGVSDNPKSTDDGALWLGRPMLQVLQDLGLPAEAVWQGVPAAERSLWNAELYAVGTAAEAWRCARWLLGLSSDFTTTEWAKSAKVSLASSTSWADSAVLAEARTRRLQSAWEMSALQLGREGGDVRPLLAYAPDLAVLADTGRTLLADEESSAANAPTKAACRQYCASLFLGQAGLDREAARARQQAFSSIEKAVQAGIGASAFQNASPCWQHQAVTVTAPARIDFGGGWSDTPPFCLDWGGTVLNMGVSINGVYPVRASVRRIDEPEVRCVSVGSGDRMEYRTSEDILGPLIPGSPFTIAQAALQLMGLGRADHSFAERLYRLGGGLEISTQVDLPMGSGLGTSSILCAALAKALGEMVGVALSEQSLVEQVLLMEQMMTTGGGWQDQAGAIFPGLKLISSRPGSGQQLRVTPIPLSDARRDELAERFVLYYTGIRRLAKGLLAQVVGRYLARDERVVQALHSIKSLATEMAYAVQGGEWDYLGQLLNRHWQINQILDPHTTNAPISNLLEELQPWVAGAKLAGAGGGGFLLLLAKGPEAARKLRVRLASINHGGAVYGFESTNDSLKITWE